MRANFRTRARALEQLGEQLIKSNDIALLELIKNSYDACATKCEVILESPADPENGILLIKDNGHGMDEAIIMDAWLEIGTDYKSSIADSYIECPHGENRLPLGEKGIGRFGVHRLGREIELITRREGKEEFVARINWDNIRETKYVEELPIDIEKRTPYTFKGGSGTQIIIKRFRDAWTRGMARDCARTITSLNSPFDPAGKFRTTFELPDCDWLKGVMTLDQVEQYKIIKFDVVLDGNKITKFDYHFTPWPMMKKLSSRHVTIEDLKAKSLDSVVIKGIKRDQVESVDLSAHGIGPVRFKGL